MLPFSCIPSVRYVRAKHLVLGFCVAFNSLYTSQGHWPFFRIIGVHDFLSDNKTKLTSVK